MEKMGRSKDLGDGAVVGYIRWRLGSEDKRTGRNESTLVFTQEWEETKQK